MATAVASTVFDFIILEGSLAFGAFFCIAIEAQKKEFQTGIIILKLFSKIRYGIPLAHFLHRGGLEARVTLTGQLKSVKNGNSYIDSFFNLAVDVLVGDKYVMEPTNIALSEEESLKQWEETGIWHPTKLSEEYLKKIKPLQEAWLEEWASKGTSSIVIPSPE